MINYYAVVAGQAPEDVLNDLRHVFAMRPVEPGDPLDYRMPPESLTVILQIGIEHLARLGGAVTGDMVCAGAVNRGLLVYLREREAVRERGARP